MEEYLMKIDGQNGNAIAYDNKIVLSRKGFKAFMVQGFAGDRTFYYKDITSIDFRKPSLIANGYIKIITSGIQDTNNAKNNFLGSTMEAAKDPNTVILRAFKKDTANKTEEFYNLIMRKIAASKEISSNSNHFISNADEIKKFKELLDIGAISKEEFEKKKNELLNL